MDNKTADAAGAAGAFSRLVDIVARLRVSFKRLDKGGAVENNRRPDKAEGPEVPQRERFSKSENAEKKQYRWINKLKETDR
jgi:hypothetical protein